MFRSLAIIAFLFIASAASAEEDDHCPIDSKQDPLPVDGSATLEPSYAEPENKTDCEFYRAAWHSFLFATQPGKDRYPAFWHYPKLNEVFPTAYPAASAASSGMELQARDPEPILNSENRKKVDLAGVDDGFTQAAKTGIGSILVDINGNPVFYSVYVNDRFKKFVHDNGLDDLEQLLKAGATPKDLKFPRGVVEFKASWMIVEGRKVDFSRYFVVDDAPIPNLKKFVDSDGMTRLQVDTSKPARQVKLALLALHVVIALDNHPEFVWASFEHSNASGARDLVPVASDNPTRDGAVWKTLAIDNAGQDYPLFSSGTSPDQGNKPVPAEDFDDATQKFPHSTSIFRVFPGSVWNSAEEDGDLSP